MADLLPVFKAILIVYGMVATMLGLFFTLVLAVFVAHVLLTEYRSDRRDLW